jgi:two-component system, cell cycle response regulator
MNDPFAALGAVSTGWWLALLAVICLAAASGFGAGMACARWSERRAFERARTGLLRIFQTVLESLDSARDACRLLEKYPGRILEPNQIEQLESRRGGLLEALGKLVQRAVPDASKANGDQASSAVRIVNWLRHPIDPQTELPDRGAFDANLAELVETCRANGGGGSLLLVRVDKLPGLTARFGQSGGEKLLKRLAAVVCRAVRNEDLVCRCNHDTLGILMPEIGVATATRLGRVVRDTVRAAHFHVEEGGPEVLLTASFGCTPCRPGENADLVLNRAFDALAKSQRLGRNQLHLHDGEALVHCAAV